MRQVQHWKRETGNCAMKLWNSMRDTNVDNGQSLNPTAPRNTSESRTIPGPGTIYDFKKIKPLQFFSCKGFFLSLVVLTSGKPYMRIS